MAAGFKSRATKVVNFVQINHQRFWTFDNGHFAYSIGDGVKCCNARGRSFANTGHYAPLVEAQHKAMQRFERNA